MGGTRRFALACAAAVAVVVALAGCSGLTSAAILPNAQAAGEVIGAEAGAGTPTPTPTPQYSVNSGWTDTVGCPSEMFAGISAGMASGGTVTPTTPSSSSGPTALPALTSKFVPSCSFTFTSAKNASIVGRGEIFIGMGQSYQTLFTSGIVHAGFVVHSTVSGTVLYTRGRSVVGVSYLAPGTEGYPYSVVAVLGVN